MPLGIATRCIGYRNAMPLPVGVDIIEVLMTNIALIAITRAGLALAGRLAPALPAIVWVPARFAAELPAAMALCDRRRSGADRAGRSARSIVFIGSAGIAVRSLAPIAAR